MDSTTEKTEASNLTALPLTSVGVNPAFDLIGLTRLRNDPQFAGIDGSNLSVVVIDTGIDADHPQLRDNFSAFVDFVYGGSNPAIISDPSLTTYTGEHGTHVAGTVGSSDPNIGVASDVNLISLQVFQNGGGASFTDIQEALEWVYNNRDRYNIVAVNMSLGAGSYTNDRTVRDTFTILNDDINRLESSGIAIVSAAGNSYEQSQTEGVGIPAILSSIAAGAVWQDGRTNSSKQVTGADRIAYFSQRLDAPNTVFAPGGTIYSTIPNGGFEGLQGTSMASPHIAGAIALMQEAALQFGGRKLSTLEVTDIIYSTADIINDGDDENDVVQNYNAVVEIQKRFGSVGGVSGDANGTLAGAILAATLDGSPISPIFGSIGIDGANTNIGNKDVDIYKFNLTTAGNVTIELGADPNNIQNFDSYLRLFNADGTEIANADDGGVGEFSKLTATLNVGSYYVGVSGYNNSGYNPNLASSGVAGATGNYSLQMSLGNSDPNGSIGGAVAVNLKTDQQGNPVKFDGFIGADLGLPVGVSDVDLYKIVVPDNGTLYIDTDTPDDTDFVDSFLRIFDAEGNELNFSDDDRAYDAYGEAESIDFSLPSNFDIYDEVTGEYGHSTDSFIASNVKRGEVYYIGISDYYNSDYDPRNLNDRIAPESTGGLYDLYINFLNNDLNGSIPQARTDFNRTVKGQVGIIGQDGRDDGTLADVGDRDVDFFKIASNQAGILEFEINSNNSDPLDSLAFIFDSQGNLIAADNDSNSFDSLIQYKIEANQDYYVAVAGQGNNNFDPFQLGSGAAGDTGKYTFNSRLRPLADLAALADDRADYSAVQNIAFDTPIEANIGEDGSLVLGAKDIDLYRFQATGSEAIKIRTNANEEFGADTFLRFFDSQGNEIAFNDNENNQTRGSALNVSVTAGSTYYIGVNGTSSQARNYQPLTGEGAADGSRGSYTLNVNPVLEVLAVNANDSGFVVNFSRPVDSSKLDLYYGINGASDSPDLVLTNKTTGETVRGSLVFSSDKRNLTFVKTGGVLTAGEYELTMFDRADAFPFDRSNYITQFTIENNDDRLLTTKDFSRSLEQTFGLPVTLDRGEGVTKVQFTLSYDKDLLNVTGASLGANIPASWQIIGQSFDNGTGKANITLEGAESLISGANDLLNLDAKVIASSDLYGSTGLVLLENLQLNDGSINVRGDRAIVQVTAFGDVSGNGDYSSLDAALISRVGLGLDSGYEAFGTIDPYLLSDINSDNRIKNDDALAIAQKAVGLPNSLAGLD
jgi:Subtilase family/Bacterial pre-peptidase C-terminal domain